MEEGVGNNKISKFMLKKVVGIIIIFITVLFGIGTLYILVSNGEKKDIYCTSEKKCITLWKKRLGEVYVILGKHKNKEVPSCSCVRIQRENIIDIIFANDSTVLITLNGDSQISHTMCDGVSIERYSDNKELNDSLYTWFDGKYKRYKKEIEFISIDFRENYVTKR